MDLRKGTLVFNEGRIGIISKLDKKGYGTIDFINGDTLSCLLKREPILPLCQVSKHDADKEIGVLIHMYLAEIITVILCKLDDTKTIVRANS